MKHPLLLVLCVLVAGCVQSSAASSSLDRFDSLAAALHDTTHLSASVSADIRAINRAMAHDRTGQIKQWAGRLERDAAQLQRKTVQLTGKVRRVMDAQSKGLERQYVGLTLGTLWHQRWEAGWAGLLARTLRRDPLLVSQQNYRMALHRSREARRAAGAAVSDANRAWALLTRHPGTFGRPSESPTRSSANHGGSGE